MSSEKDIRPVYRGSLKDIEALKEELRYPNGKIEVYTGDSEQCKKGK